MAKHLFEILQQVDRNAISWSEREKALCARIAKLERINRVLSDAGSMQIEIARLEERCETLEKERERIVMGVEAVLEKHLDMDALDECPHENHDECPWGENHRLLDDMRAALAGEV